mgnify:CR=1 FL=1
MMHLLQSMMQTEIMYGLLKSAQVLILKMLLEILLLMNWVILFLLPEILVVLMLILIPAQLHQLLVEELKEFL